MRLNSKSGCCMRKNVAQVPMPGGIRRVWSGVVLSVPKNSLLRGSGLEERAGKRT